MFDVVFHKGDTLPVFEKTFYADGLPVNLTGYTVTLTVRTIDDVELFTNPAEVVDADNGVVRYEFTPDDMTDIGTNDFAFGYFTATSGDLIFTVPNNRPLSMFFTGSGVYEYSYSGDPAARDIDRVRFLLNDTNMTSALFTDSEITFMMTDQGNAYAAAAELALHMSAKYTNMKSKTVGPLSIDYGKVMDQWNSLSVALRKRGASQGGGGPIFGGGGHYFYTGMHDNKNYSSSNNADENPDALLGGEEL